MRSMFLVIPALSVIAAANVFPADYRGTVRAGYIYTDLEGNHAVNQGTFNLYDGVALSLNDFSANLRNGYQFNADLTNVTLHNRRLSLGLSKPGLLGVSFNHSAYRRVFDFNGNHRTKRYLTDGRLWWQAHEWFRLYGDIAVNSVSGDAGQYFGGIDHGIFSPVDYGNTRYGLGLTYRRRRTTGTVEYRGSSYNDDAAGRNDRRTRRLKITASSPIPRYERLVVAGGLQNFRMALDGRDDSLHSQTLWGGARLYLNHGYQFRYSFLFDRARRTGDVVETDNLVHALYVGRVWRSKGGVTLGYQRRINDDVFDERTGNNWYVSGWFKPIPALTLDAGHGSETLEVATGQTLTGRRDRNRAWVSAKYRYSVGWLRMKVTNRETEYEEIGSDAEYLRFAGDTWLDLPRYGQVSASYSYHTGEYENTTSLFEFTEHIVSGDVTSLEYYGARAGLGGTYFRSGKDTDVESFSIRVSGSYTHTSGAGLEVIYTSHNFDNFADPGAFYSEYYTDNVLQLNLSYRLD